DMWIVAREVKPCWVHDVWSRHAAVAVGRGLDADTPWPGHEMPWRKVWMFHAAQPTAAGWRMLARRRGEDDPCSVSWHGREHDALAALKSALSTEVGQRAYEVLRGWSTAMSRAEVGT